MSAETLLLELRYAYSPLRLRFRKGYEYCNEHLSVCLPVRKHISGNSRNTRSIFTTCFVQVTSGRGGVAISYVLPVL